VNDVVVYSENNNYMGTTSMCGDTADYSYGERISNLDVYVDHAGTDITVTFTSSLNEGPGNESWGIRELTIEDNGAGPDVYEHLID